MDVFLVLVPVISGLEKTCILAAENCDKISRLGNKAGMGLSLGTLDILHEKKLCISLQPNVIMHVRIQE